MPSFCKCIQYIKNNLSYITPSLAGDGIIQKKKIIYPYVVICNQILQTTVIRVVTYHNFKPTYNTIVNLPETFSIQN